MSKPFVIGEGLRGSVTRVWEKQEQKPSVKHTPAPWKVFGTAGFAKFKVVDASGRSIAAFPSTSTRPSDERSANAALIAAAPELLEALNWLLNNPNEERGSHTAITFAHAAIAKAGGAA